MSDPTQIPEGAGEIAKLGGSTGLGAAIVFLVQRLWGSADKRDAQINAKLDVITAGVSEVKAEVGDVRSDLKVLTNDRLRDMETVKKLESVVDKLENEVAELRGAFKHHLSGQIVE